MARYYVEVNANGTFWYKNPEMNIPHREDGPAIEFASGGKIWYIDGKRHRLDGPAIEYPNGDVDYWLNDVRLTKQQWEEVLQSADELTIGQIEQLLGKRIKVVKE